MTDYIYDNIDRSEIYAEPPFNYRLDLHKNAWRIFVDGRTIPEFHVRLLLDLIIF